MNSENERIPQEYTNTQNQETNELKSLEKKDFYKNVALELTHEEIYKEDTYTPEIKNYNPDYFAAKARDFGINGKNIASDGSEDALIQKMLDEYAEAATIAMSYENPNRNRKVSKSLVLYKDSEFLIDDLSKSIYEKKDGEIIQHVNPKEFSLDAHVDFVLSKEGYEKITGKHFEGDNDEFPVLGKFFASDKKITLRISEATPGFFTDKNLQEIIKEKWKLAE